MSDWISVKERLPERAGVYLTYMNGITQTAFYDRIEGIWVVGKNKLPVTHWMPLPEPPLEPSPEDLLRREQEG